MLKQLEVVLRKRATVSQRVTLNLIPCAAEGRRWLEIMRLFRDVLEMQGVFLVV